jgi:hypothetical protein
MEQRHRFEHWLEPRGPEPRCAPAPLYSFLDKPQNMSPNSCSHLELISQPRAHRPHSSLANLELSISPLSAKLS